MSSMIAAEPVVAKKLRIKFSSQIIEAAPARKICKTACSVSENSYNGQNVKHNCTVQVSNRRSPSGMEELQPMKKQKMMEELQSMKKQKMDRGVMQQCFSLVKSLITHPSGWVFREPVDPVALNIPDYFSIISKPMDLGTISSKLERSLYCGTDEFAADVRLTFSNAMLYNPPTNYVHTIAVTLKRIFETKWKSLEEKWNREASKSVGGKFSRVKIKETSDTSQNSPDTPPLKNIGLSKKTKSSEDKAVRSSSNVRAAEVKLSKPIENCIKKAVEHNSQKGTDSDGRQTCAPANVNPSLSIVADKCGKCGRSACRCSLHSDSANATSGITCERSSGRDHTCSTDTSKLAVRGKSMSTSQMSKSDPDSDGAVSGLDDEYMCPSSQLMTPATDATSGWKPPIFDVQLSPTKALRAAMLKRRFADTILKAQHKTLLDQGDKADPVKLQQEKERLEKRQREEKAWIEARIREAEAASRKREELELKKQREKEREAARIALQKMEKTADIVLNLDIVKELEKISGCTLSYGFSFRRKGAEMAKREIQGTQFGSPLERLGLYIKDDDIEDVDDVLNGDEEEGEIF
ncbi:transcription factor GTE12 isoform X2 [Euphorbia lathyris]|uniref:transcription factor GTE12 isoform X2 n=1 Tax=Euphorbia lathyris TaxID=212925 RepID=UPI003313B2CE